ncbi:undecaprenyldiphospho-muramoylpentapeptide beta-N-acetylglucosaminyltransferase [Caviibacter abscessus]|uniref:undecaprenyldiphospho-muramoylpentapeptide beta-N-acetylglucosaminyltransferase n=1 Tax=Caviibacter abscessus TaxID=1766719 RepID=UPI0008381BB4|nr:undecaprenyldiphospho-muramoylpentapeptide beta-N-acetylglucosaminyltransferase [Caviibacter abscessus]
MKRVVLTTGGTGGHIYPAISLAKSLKEEGYEVTFIGTCHRMEKDIVTNAGYDFIGLDVVPLRSVKSILKMISAIFQARKILKEKNIDMVIGFGNYISIPSIIAAKLLNKTIYLQEQNVLMGLANKYGYRFAKKVFLAYKTSLNYIPKKYHHKFIVTGNPLRHEFYTAIKSKNREKLEISEHEKVIFVMGGSLGAKPINEAIIKNIEKINEKQNLKFYWSTGESLFKETYAKIKNLKNIILMPYFENACELMSAADLVICRAGASTISELLQLKKPSVMIPYSFVGQKENAEMLEYADATKTFTNEQAVEAIDVALNLCYQDDKLEFMIDNISKLDTGNAVENIITIIKGDNSKC